MALPMLMPRKLSPTLPTLCALAVTFAIFTSAALAQPPAPPQPGDPPAYVPTLTFDVASVRETHQPEDDASWQMGLISAPHSSQFEANGIILKVLIQSAYGFGPYEIAGAPDWMNSAFWVVQAKSDHSVDQQLARLTDDQAKLEKQHMMQQLLADRFKLKVHWETRQANVYALVIGKSGSKLQPGKVESADPDGPSSPDPAPPQNTGSSIKDRDDPQGHVLTVSHITPTGIAALLGTLLRINVQDKTALTGRYDFTLQYSRRPDADSFPAIPVAIQEQLGLKLEPTHGSVDVLVIDHIERPTPN
jgi:uncharacterized protein (TIGR03435 family)